MPGSRPSTRQQREPQNDLGVGVAQPAGRVVTESVDVRVARLHRTRINPSQVRMMSASASSPQHDGDTPKMITHTSACHANGRALALRDRAPQGASRPCAAHWRRQPSPVYHLLSPTVIYAPRAQRPPTPTVNGRLVKKRTAPHHVTSRHGRLPWQGNPLPTPLTLLRATCKQRGVASRLNMREWTQTWPVAVSSWVAGLVHRPHGVSEVDWLA